MLCEPGLERLTEQRSAHQAPRGHGQGIGRFRSRDLPEARVFGGRFELIG
jgi:hypothetical protein